MRLILDNDGYTLHGRTDYALTEKSLLNSKATAGDTSIEVINSAGFNDDDYIVLGELGDERAEVVQITTVIDNTFVVPAIKFNHDNKDKVYRLSYNQVKFYEDDTNIATIDIQPDYYTQYSQDVDLGKTYSISYYNSETAKETNRGEVLNGWEYNLCSVSDVLQYETTAILGNKILDKIDISSREVRSTFLSQDQTFTDLSARDLSRLREPVALRTLYLIFLELIKNKDDTATIKADIYLNLYTSKMREITDVISKENSNVKIFSQARIIR